MYIHICMYMYMYIYIYIYISCVIMYKRVGEVPGSRDENPTEGDASGSAVAKIQMRLPPPPSATPDLKVESRRTGHRPQQLPTSRSEVAVRATTTTLDAAHA